MTSTLPKSNAAERLGALRAVLQRPTLVRMHDNGRGIGYRFPANADALAKNQLRTLFSALRFTMPTGAERTWTEEDQSAVGKFEVRYTRRGASDAGRAELRRERVRLIQLQARNPGETRTQLESRGTATLCMNAGWLIAADVREVVTLQLPQFGANARTTTTSRLALTESSLVSLSDQPEPDWSGSWAPLTADLDEVQTAAADREAAKWRRELANMPVQGLVDWFMSLHANDAASREAYTEAWNHIAWKCRLDPKAIEAIVAIVRAGRMPGPAADALLTAMGDAATPAAQAALVGLHADRRLDVGIRAASAVGLLQSPKPTASTLSHLIATVTGPNAKTDLGKMSLLVLGALAGRTSEPLADGRTPMATLIAMETTARKQGRLDAWLLALGNSGSPQTVDHAARHLDSKDAKVREAAASALRLTKSSRACDLLVRRATQDKAPEVRRKAAESLAEHATPRARSALRKLVRSEKIPAVREAMLLGLADNPQPADFDLLREVAQSDSNEQLRKLAAAILRSS